MSKNCTKNKKNAVILAIETSCDDTAAAVFFNDEEKGICIAPQADIHNLYGGIVPEIACRNHTVSLPVVVDNALREAGVGFESITHIAVTKEPGLIGALIVGNSYAKALGLALDVPVVFVNHIQAHIAAIFINNKSLVPPFLACVTSGGHTAVIDVCGYDEYNVIMQTADDAMGECFDKCARVLGLRYPGGPEIEARAKQGSASIKFFKSARIDGSSISYSGLKTAAVNYVHNIKQKGSLTDAQINDICASVQASAVDIITSAVLKTLEKTKRQTLVLAGGVAANTLLRETLKRECEKINITMLAPPLKYCGDNASMVAVRAYLQINGAENGSL